MVFLHSCFDNLHNSILSHRLERFYEYVVMVRLVLGNSPGGRTLTNQQKECPMFGSLKSGIAKCGLVALSAITAGSIFAEDQAVSLPNTGVDVAGYATSAITSLGAVVAVCVGGVVAFMLVRAGIRWIRGIK